MKYTIRIKLREEPQYKSWRKERAEAIDMFIEKNIQYLYIPDGRPWLAFEIECEPEEFTFLCLSLDIIS